MDPLLPDPGAAAPPGVTGVTSQLIALLKWGSLILAVICVFVAAGAFAVRHQRGEGGDALNAVIGIAVLLAVATSAVSIVTWFMGG